MGSLGGLSPLLRNLMLAFDFDNPQAFRVALAELQAAFSQLKILEEVPDAYEEVAAFEHHDLP